jgi:hypothetical protein
MTADPACVRRGADPGLIAVFECLGWATAVHWPAPARLDSRRPPPGRDQSRAALQPRGHRAGRPPLLPASSDGI